MALRHLPVVFGLVGTTLLVVGLSLAVRTWRFRRRAVRCRGLLVGYDSRWSSGGDGPGQMLHYPVLEFRTADGRPVRTAGRVGKSWKSHRPGQDVPISYDPRDPEHAYVGAPLLMVFLAVVFVGIGLLFTAIAVLVPAPG